MNPFEPTSLSPVPKAATACALPYGLTWNALLPALPGFDRQRSAQAQAFASYEKQGINGGPNSCILTLHYPNGENQFHSETVFIKQIIEPWKKEAGKYLFLASKGVPIPRLLAVIPQGEAETIVLEFLPSIGIDFHANDEVNSLLHLLAQLNSIQDPPSFFQPAPGIPEDEFDEGLRTALVEAAQEPVLSFKIDLSSWLDAYHFAQRACNDMTPGLCHREFSFQQVGWAHSMEARRLVIFDLETMSPAARFTDIAGILKPLAAYTGRDALELFMIYLDRFRKLNRLELGFEQALQELRLIRILDTFYSLPWFVDCAKDPNYSKLIGTTPAMAMIWLYEDLTALNLI